MQHLIRYTSSILGRRALPILATKYTNDHEWVDDQTCKCGVTAFAAEMLGDIVFIQVPDIGDEIAKDDVMGSLESVKAASDVIAPLTGKVKNVNIPVLDDPSQLSKDTAETSGWLIQYENINSDEFGALMDIEKYKKHCEKESH